MRSVLALFGDSDGEIQAGDNDLSRLAEEILTRQANLADWHLAEVSIWTQYEFRRGDIRRSQGWKLHLSATHRSAEAVLQATLPILIRAQASFKFVRSRRLLMLLNEAHAPRTGSGKFITIYPDSDEEMVRLADACHRVTAGLPGPAILTDRRLCDDSIVYYRYGAFVREEGYDFEGRVVYLLRDPVGRAVVDVRQPWFAPPAWAIDPIRSPAGDGSVPLALHGRYRVSGALRHANKGGIYRAIDSRTSGEVIIKEARPHVAVDQLGRDAIDRLEAEARNLDRLHQLDVSPRPLDLFRESGHLFLVIERLAGLSLRQWRMQQRAPLAKAELLAMADRIATLLARCHDGGILVRDFTPNNIMVVGDGAPLRLIDPEMACVEGERLPIGIGGFTPGYTSPQQRSGKSPPERADDEYSLAATLCFLATGRSPHLLPEQPVQRSTSDRIAEQLHGMIAAGVVPAAIEAPIVDGLADDPRRRWSAARVATHVRMSLIDPPPCMVIRSDRRVWLETVRGLIRYAVASTNTADATQAVTSSCFGQQLDPCNVHSGAAGVGAFLRSARPLLDEGAQRTVTSLATWVVERLKTDPATTTRPPGLYFGTAGAAWFLLDAGPEFEDSACDIASALAPAPARGAPPARVDISHGASGIGLTWLHFYEVTRRPHCLALACDLADRVLALAEESPDGVVWRQRNPDANSDGNPDGSGALVSYGFAHGNAGIAYFLLAAYTASRDPKYLRGSEAAAETLLRSVLIEDGCAYWAHGPDRPVYWTYWCNGSSGVGTTLIRLFAVTGDERYRDAAIMAAHAVSRGRWSSYLGYCHGLAGNGHFLLDLHEFLHDAQFLHMARDLAEVLIAQAIRRQDMALFVDDTGLMVSPDFGVGTSGIGSFLLRLATGGPRPFMVDGLLAGLEHQPCTATGDQIVPR